MTVLTESDPKTYVIIGAAIEVTSNLGVALLSRYISKLSQLN